MPPSVTWPERPLMPTCGNGVARTRPENIGVGPTCETVRILVLVSCGVWRVRRCVSAAVLLCHRERGFALTSYLLKLCHLSRKTQKRNRGDGEYRTRPGEHRRRTNLRNCQDPVVLVSCGVWRRCLLCVQFFVFFANRLFAADHQSESARCVSSTRRGIVEAVADPPRECAMDETTPMFSSL